MQLWRDYLEQYADKEGNVEAQTVIAAYHSVHVLTALARILDKDGRFSELIDQRFLIFKEGGKQARLFSDCLLNATFSLYNVMNTLCHQLTEGNSESEALIRTIDEQVHQSVESADSLSRPATAMRSCFPLLALITIASDEHQVMTAAIRHIEQRFSAGAAAAQSSSDHLLNALYRFVEILQILVLLTDADLKDRIDQIADRFKEDDAVRDISCKFRNGFCRLFELGHLLTSQVNTLICCD